MSWMPGPVTEKVSELRTSPTLDGLRVKSSMIQVCLVLALSPSEDLHQLSVSTPDRSVDLPSPLVYRTEKVNQVLFPEPKLNRTENVKKA